MNHLLIISISFNFLCLIIAITAIVKRGGLRYIRIKFLNIIKYKQNIIDLNNPPYYIHKQSQYQLLPCEPTDIIFLGDSITDEGEWSELFQNNHIKNRGISGDTTERVLRRLASILAGKPKQIFLMIGINDFIMANKSVTSIITNYRQILEIFHNSIPDTEIFIQSVLPVNNNISIYWYENQTITDLNIQLKDLAQDFAATYIDVFSYLADSQQQLDDKYTSDGLHLNGDAYSIWRDAINIHIAEINIIPPTKFTT